MHKNLKNALLLGAVVALSGSVSASGAPWDHFEVDHTSNKAGTTTYNAPAEGSDAKFVRKPSGYFNLDTAAYDGDPDDTRFKTDRDDFLNQMDQAQPIYTKRIQDAKDQAAKFDPSKVKDPNPQDPKYKPKLGGAADWKDIRSKKGDQVAGEYDLGDGNKERTFGEMRTYVGAAEKAAADLLRADKEAAARLRQELKARRGYYEDIAAEEEAKANEKRQWRDAAAVAERKSARDSYVESLDNNDTKDYVKGLHPSIKDVDALKDLVARHTATAKRMTRTQKELTDAENDRLEIMELLIKLPWFSQFDETQVDELKAHLDAGLKSGMFGGSAPTSSGPGLAGGSPSGSNAPSRAASSASLSGGNAQPATQAQATEQTDQQQPLSSGKSSSASLQAPPPAGQPGNGALSFLGGAGDQSGEPNLSRSRSGQNIAEQQATVKIPTPANTVTVGNQVFEEGIRPGINGALVGYIDGNGSFVAN